MIIHIIKANDDALVSYLKNKYNLSSLEFRNELIEIRNLKSDENELMIKIFNEESFNYSLDESKSNILIIENPSRLFNVRALSKSFKQFDEALANYLYPTNRNYKIGNKEFNFTKAYLMGILNVTPDSFSDGGKYYELENAYDYALRMIEEGVDIIDIGGESTKPGSDFISEEEEKKRVLPVIEKLLSAKSDLIISIDTSKSKVAECALDLGVKIVNDISAMTLDKDMIDVCKKRDASVVLMHMQGIPKTMQQNPTYNEVISDIYDFLYDRINFVKENDINKIIIDPGIGFGKSVEDNFTIIKRLKEFSTLGYPILIGLSRKSFIRKTLNLDLDEVDFPTSILETISAMNSARIIRTHKVKNGRTLVDLINKII